MEIHVSLNDSINTEEVIDLYKSMGSEKAGNTESMWISEGKEHNS